MSLQCHNSITLILQETKKCYPLMSQLLFVYIYMYENSNVDSKR